MSAYERFRKDIHDGQYDDRDPSKKSTEDFEREARAAMLAGVMSHEESRNLLLLYIERLAKLLRGHGGNGASGATRS